MRIKLRLSKNREEAVRKELTEAKIEISEDSDLVLTEENYQYEKLICKDGADTVFIPVDDICCIESCGHDVFVSTLYGKYKSEMRLYQFEKNLPSAMFIRISNSVIIQRNSIRKIRPALSSKFYLTLINGSAVDVTRTYYYKFKDFYGI